MEMEYVYVPGTGLRVSRVCIGAMMFGKKILQGIVGAVDKGFAFIHLKIYKVCDQCKKQEKEQVHDHKKFFVLSPAFLFSFFFLS